MLSEHCSCCPPSAHPCHKKKCCKRKCRCHKKYCCIKPCDCTDLTYSIAETESALAKILDAEATVLKNSAGQWTNEQIEIYTQHIEKTLKKIILKEIILCLMLEEKCCSDPCCLHGDWH